VKRAARAIVQQAAPPAQRLRADLNQARRNLKRTEDDLSATNRAYRETHLAAVDVFEMVVEMERQGAIRLPWPQHSEKMDRLKEALGR
jgi:hypothetical protein